MLLKDFAQRLKLKNVPVPDIYFILLDAASITPDISAISHAKAKERGAWIPFKIRTTKVAKDFTRKDLQHMVLCASWQKQRNSLRQRSKNFYIQRLHILGSHKQHENSKKMRAFARFKNEIWCMYLADVNKLSNYTNGVKFLLVRQDLFDRTGDAKGMKTKDSKETVNTFPKMITKKNKPKKVWVDQGT